MCEEHLEAFNDVPRARHIETATTHRALDRGDGKESRESAAQLPARPGVEPHSAADR